MVARALTADKHAAVAEPASPLQPQFDIRGKGPDFSNLVLHWQDRSFTSSPSSPDMANGKWVVVDNWVKMGPLNQPVAVRTIATLEDGTFYQASLLLPEQGVILLGQKLATIQFGQQSFPAGECAHYLSGPAAAAQMAGRAPVYMDLTKAVAKGLRWAELPPITPPAVTAGELHTKPQQLVDSTNPGWLVGEVVVSQGTVYGQLEVDRDTGLQRVYRAELKNRNGELLVQQDFTSSAIEVFPADAVPGSIFSESSLPEC